MNEQDFDRKIRETALNHESKIEKPLWNKTGTWNRVESGLGKSDRSVWWKVAAMLLLFFSIGMSYAQWEKFVQYKEKKEIELTDLQQQLTILATDQQNLKNNTQIMLRQKSEEIKSLKNQLLLIKITSQRSEFRSAAFLQSNLSKVLQKQITDQKLIDSLKNTIHQLQATVQATKQSINQEEKEEIKQTTGAVKNEVAPERRIYYISNHVKSENAKQRKGLKIGIFGMPDNKEVKYQSDYSIFKK